MEKNVGIWIDKKHALIVDLSQSKIEVMEIESNLEFFNPKGGTRSKTVYGPMITVKEKSYMEREKRQSIVFFQNILYHIKDCHQLYIFGPGEMKKTFKKFMDEQNLEYPKVIGMKTSDNVTNNQLVAKVKAIFSDN